jgi:enoyl-CoA hydratase/carnithine racemase
MTATAGTLVRYDMSDAGIATIALDDPGSRNALSDAMLDALIAAFERARDDETVRCVVLGSTHDRVFSSGGDLGGFAADVPLVVRAFFEKRAPEWRGR